MSSSKSQTKRLNIGKSRDKSRLEEESKDSKVVSHSLLRKRQVSRFENNVANPLQSNNGDKIGSLSKLECLSGIANLVIGQPRLSPEGGNGFVIRVPPALDPRRGLQVVEEESDINISMFCQVPSNSTSWLTLD